MRPRSGAYTGPRLVDPAAADDCPLSRRLVRLVPLAIALALTWLAFSQFLNTGFAATDSWPLVVTSRFSNPGGPLQQFRQPVMAGTRFIQSEVVYRPLPSVSFGLDHQLWGLNPFGYHLTNTVLHCLAVISVWALLLALGLRHLSAAVGAALFGLHPLAVATVPVIARRDSILPVLAITATAACLLAADRSCSTRRWTLYSLALICATAGLLSKESAFAGVLLVSGLLLAARLARGQSLADVVRGIVLVLPFGALIVLFFIVRWLVVGGLGGGSEAANLFPPDLEKYSQTIGAFTRDLAWVAAGAASSTREIWPRLAACVLVGLVACSVVLGRRYGVLLIAGTGWLVAFILFAAVLKIATIAWLAYFSLVGVAIIVAGGLEGGLARSRTPGPRGRVASLLTAGLVVGLTGYVVATMSASPVVRQYDQWAIAGAVTDDFSSALRQCVESHPGATRTVIIDIPSTLEDGRVETNLMGVTLIEQYTVDAILTAHYPGREFSTAIDGYATLRQGAESVGYACLAPAPDTVRLAASS